MIDLGTLGGSRSSARDINNNGQVVGESFVAGDTSRHAFLYSGGKMTDLGLGYAWAINDSGQVVGSFGGWQSALYENGTIIDLGNVVANDINNSGQIVGGSSIYSGGSWTDLNSLIDPSLGWTIASAIGINDSGQIAVYASSGTYGNRALLLTPLPVPEAQTYAMMLAGLGLIGFTARRRKHAKP